MAEGELEGLKRQVGLKQLPRTRMNERILCKLDASAITGGKRTTHALQLWADAVAYGSDGVAYHGGSLPRKTASASIAELANAACAARDGVAAAMAALHAVVWQREHLDRGKASQVGLRSKSVATPPPCAEKHERNKPTDASEVWGSSYPADSDNVLDVNFTASATDEPILSCIVDSISGLYGLHAQLNALKFARALCTRSEAFCAAFLNAGGALPVKGALVHAWTHDIFQAAAQALASLCMLTNVDSYKQALVVDVLSKRDVHASVAQHARCSCSRRCKASAALVASASWVHSEECTGTSVSGAEPEAAQPQKCNPSASSQLPSSHSACTGDAKNHQKEQQAYMIRALREALQDRRMLLRCNPQGFLFGLICAACKSAAAKSALCGTLPEIVSLMSKPHANRQVREMCATLLETLIRADERMRMKVARMKNGRALRVLLQHSSYSSHCALMELLNATQVPIGTLADGGSFKALSASLACAPWPSDTGALHSSIVHKEANSYYNGKACHHSSCIESGKQLASGKSKITASPAKTELDTNANNTNKGAFAMVQCAVCSSERADMLLNNGLQTRVACELVSECKSCERRAIEMIAVLLCGCPSQEARQRLGAVVPVHSLIGHLSGSSWCEDVKPFPLRKAYLSLAGLADIKPCDCIAEGGVTRALSIISCVEAPIEPFLRVIDAATVSCATAYGREELREQGIRGRLKDLQKDKRRSLDKASRKLVNDALARVRTVLSTVA